MKQVKYRGLKGKIIELLKDTPNGLTQGQLKMIIGRTMKFNEPSFRAVISKLARTHILKTYQEKHTCPLCGTEKFLYKFNEGDK